MYAICCRLISQTCMFWIFLLEYVCWQLLKVQEMDFAVMSSKKSNFWAWQEVGVDKKNFGSTMPKNWTFENWVPRGSTSHSIFSSSNSKYPFNLQYHHGESWSHQCAWRGFQQQQWQWYKCPPLSYSCWATLCWQQLHNIIAHNNEYWCIWRWWLAIKWSWCSTLKQVSQEAD